MNILLIGANGKMGKCIVNCLSENAKIIAGIDNNKNEKLHGNLFPIYNGFEKLDKEKIENIDVVLDFALPSILRKELMFCVKYKKPLVICSTGHLEDELKLIEKASEVIPIFKTTNTSFGVALINKIIKENINSFCNFDICVLEKHHRNKKDSPSGTAKTILSNFSDCGNVDNFSIRAGTVVGEHEIMIFGDGEQISIKHIAESRDLFAKSAINICEFLIKQNKCKLYEMNDLF